MKRKIGSSFLSGSEKTVAHESENYTNREWYFWYSHGRIIKGTGEIGNRSTSGDYQNCNIENNQNSEKSPGDFRRLAVTQTPMKDHQLKLM